MYLGDQLAGVHLTLQQGAGETSAVDIRVDAGDEQLEAHLQVNGEHIEGYLVGNTPEEVTKLEKTSDIFLERIQTDTSADWKAEKLPIVSSRDMTRMAAGEKKCRYHRESDRYGTVVPSGKRIPAGCRRQQRKVRSNT